MAATASPHLQTCYLIGHGGLGTVLARTAGKLPDIGAVFTQGENLCIVLTRTVDDSTLANFMHSLATALPDFAGELIVWHPNQQLGLEPLAKILPKARTKVVVCKSTVPSSAEKNHELLHCRSEWVWFVDPCALPAMSVLTEVLVTLEQTGAHFCVVPELDADGRVYCAVAESQGAETGDLALRAVRKVFNETFIFDNALLLPDRGGFFSRRETLLGLNGLSSHDVGDVPQLDLATRIFDAGMKIAVARAGQPFQEDVAQGTDYPLAHKLIRHYTDDIGKWMRPYGLEAFVEADELSRIHVSTRPRPRIALVIDVDFWAFGNIARQISRYLSDRYEFMVIPVGIVSSINHVLMLAKDCKLIHFFWREDARQIGSPYYNTYAQSLGFQEGEFDRLYLDGKILTTSVYDHLMLSEADTALRLPVYQKLITGYTVASEKLYDIYSALPGYPAPSIVTEDGVDLNLFHPMNMSRFNAVEGRPIVVGWVGNSKWEAATEDFKGLHSLLEPAIEELRQEGFALKSFFADRQVRFIPHHEMPAYYSQIDVYVCASKIEGTPNPVLEAMACGVPVISTDVGIVPQVFGQEQKAFILPERTVAELKSRLRILLQKPDLLRTLSAENLRSIQDWHWEVKARKFGVFFDNLLGMQ